MINLASGMQHTFPPAGRSTASGSNLQPGRHVTMSQKNDMMCYSDSLSRTPDLFVSVERWCDSLTMMMSGCPEWRTSEIRVGMADCASRKCLFTMAMIMTTPVKRSYHHTIVFSSFDPITINMTLIQHHRHCQDLVCLSTTLTMMMSGCPEGADFRNWNG